MQRRNFLATIVGILASPISLVLPKKSIYGKSPLIGCWAPWRYRYVFYNGTVIKHIGDFVIKSTPVYRDGKFLYSI